MGPALPAGQGRLGGAEVGVEAGRDGGGCGGACESVVYESGDYGAKHHCRWGADDLTQLSCMHSAAKYFYWLYCTTVLYEQMDVGGKILKIFSGHLY